MNSLDEIARLVRQCSDCELGLGRKNAVPGEGSPDADLMIIGGRAIFGRVVRVHRLEAGRCIYRQHGEMPSSGKPGPIARRGIGMR